MQFSSFNFFMRYGAYLWAFLLVLLALALPRDGGWTIDDGVKRIGTSGAQPHWHVILPDGPVRSALRDPAAYPPFSPPFAQRQNGGFQLGFSSWTMLLWGFLAKIGTLAFVLMPALASLVVWLLLRRWYKVADEVVIFLPLTFYGLVLWEHSIALALETAALVLLFRGRVRAGISSVLVAAALLSVSVLLRPEVALLVPVIFVWLWRRDGVRSAAVLLLVSVVIILGGLLFSRGHGSSFVPAQVLLNFKVSGADINSLGQALLERLEAFWVFGLTMDSNIWISLGLLLALMGGSYLVFVGEKRNQRRLLAVGCTAFLVWIVIVQLRLWTHSLPPVALLSRNSLFYAFPWILLFFFCGNRERKPFLLAAVILALLISLTTPVFRGVHWGPRLLLPALPLLFIAYVRQREEMMRYRWLWHSLVILTVIQTLSSVALIYGRQIETAQRVQFLRDKINGVLVVPSQSQVADLAPLWDDVEMFTVQGSSNMRRFIADARRADVQSFWFLSAVSGRESAEKASKTLMRLEREYEFETGNLWKTSWWLGRFEDSGDSASWGVFYDELARRELAQGRFQRALPEHESAIHFQSRQADYHYNYAVTLGRLGFYTEAEHELRRALSADSLHTAAQDLLRRIEMESSR